MQRSTVTKWTQRGAVALLATLLGACGVEPSVSDVTQAQGEGPDTDIKPTGKGVSRWAGKTGGGGTGISYHGGPVMLGTANVYAIWYGNWAQSTTPTILNNFITSESGSPYYNINTTYYNGQGQHVSNAIALMGSTTDAYSRGTAINDNDVQTIVATAISKATLPYDVHGIYFVFTSADVNETTGFCSQYCGWHWHGTINGGDIKYAFIGDPTRCPSACEAQTVSPNNNPGADGMVSIFAHELEETTSDPDGNAWYDQRGNENADKCAWTFGTTYLTANGSYANMNLGGYNYLVQRNWVNAGSGGCTLHYP